MEIDDSSFSIGNGFSRIEIRHEGWTDGEVVTPHGIVSIYAQGDKKYDCHTRLDFAHNGRFFVRFFSGKRYSKRGIVTKAKEFAREIINLNKDK